MHVPSAASIHLMVWSTSLFALPCSQLYTAGHPLEPGIRNGISGPEYAKAITIGTICKQPKESLDQCFGAWMVT